MPARDPPSGVLNRVAECAPLEADQSGFRLGRQDHEYELHRPDEKDRLYDKANRGDYICVAAPGVDIIAPALKGGYDWSSGTSRAAAHVSGVVALLLERDDKLDWSGARAILSSSARKSDPPIAAEAFGAGIVDAASALGAGHWHAGRW